MRDQLFLSIILMIFMLLSTDGITQGRYATFDEIVSIPAASEDGSTCVPAGILLLEKQETILPPDEHRLGTTLFDGQAIYILGNTTSFNEQDGTISAVWTKGDSPLTFPLRGSGYNFYDGSSWQPEPPVRIENERSGYPSYAILGEGEIVVSQMVNGLKISRRTQRGSGNWQFSSLAGPPESPGLMRPSVITSGPDHNTVHLLAVTEDPFSGQEQALLYYRSTDGGDSWDIQHHVLTGLGSEYYNKINRDSYSWAESRGDTLAFVVAYAWHDLFVMKSTDNGFNWDKILVWEHPYPFFDWYSTITDTLFCVDHSASIAMDNDGMVHVAFGISRVIHPEPIYSYYVYRYIDGIGYWNETMPAFSSGLNALAPPRWQYPGSEMVEDYNYVGWSPDTDGDGQVTYEDYIMMYTSLGISTAPSICVDDNGWIFLVYASSTENYGNGEYQFKHIWSRAWSPAQGWSSMIDLSSDIAHVFDECFFPQIMAASDEFIHVTFNTDMAPGLAMYGDHAWVENSIIYKKIPKANFLFTSLTEDHVDLLDEIKVYPNPVSGTALISVQAPFDSELHLWIGNVLGEQVHAETRLKSSEHNHVFSVDMSGNPAGIYLYRVLVNGRGKTGKIIVH